MKAIILAAGKGTRLKNVGFKTLKHLIPINGIPYIGYILNNLKKSNIQDIGIVISQDDKITPKIFKDGSGLGLKIQYIYQGNLRGTAMAIKSAQEFVGEEKFLVHLGSDMFENNFQDAIKIFERSNPDAMILTYAARDIHLHGMAVIENKKVKRVVEKPEKEISEWILTGCYLFTGQIFKAINLTSKSIKSLNKNEIVVTDAIQKMIDLNFNVLAYKTNGWWGVLRTKETFKEIAALLTKKESKI